MFEEFLKRPVSWIKDSEENIIFSSRIRLARNLANFPFPERANSSEREEIRKKVKSAILRLEEFKKAFFINMEDLNILDKQFLLERHLISQEHMINSSGKGLVISFDEKISIMINEEDHIRFQILEGGFKLGELWERINYLDDCLSGYLSFAFLPNLGFLTSCPTNVGTGLRASCMLHLPGLVMTKRINKILELLAKLSFTSRGLFGEGTQALGDFFQISNQVSLGLSEKELVENLTGIVRQVKEQEEQARQVLLKKQRISLEDNIARALGILKHARLITTKEALHHLSLLYLGIDLGIIKNVSRQLIKDLFIKIQPAHLQKKEGRVLKEEERDYIRAYILRKELNGDV